MKLQTMFLAIAIILATSVPQVFSQDHDVVIWYGNPDGSPIEAPIGAVIPIDVYIEAADSIYLQAVLLPLGLEDQYFNSYLSHSMGQVYDVLTEWAETYFWEPFGQPYNPEGWSCESFFGIRCIFPPCEEADYFHCETPTKILSFIVEIADDPGLIGNTVQCLGPGVNPNFPSGTELVDSLGFMISDFVEHYCPVLFVSPDDPDYQGTVAGIVSNEQGSPIEGVTIEIDGHADLTNANGQYIIEGIIQGMHDIFFSHPGYCDTVITSVFISANETTTVNAALGGAGNMIGVVTDMSSNSVEEVVVSVLETGYADTTDINGEYLLTGLCPGVYDVSLTHPNFADNFAYDISIMEGETTVLDAVMWPETEDEVTIWYGNPYVEPVITLIGDTVFIDVYVQTQDNVDIAFIYAPLGTEDQYIVDHYSHDNGQLYYPLTEWDEAYFQPTAGSPPNPDGWSCEPFVGISNIFGPPEPFLHSESPVKIATFVVGTADDPYLEGQTIECLAPGTSYETGGPGGFVGDIDGQFYSLTEIYCPLYFTTSLNGAIAGVVRDTESNPIENVIVTAINADVADATNNLGEYYLGDLPPGSYSVSFSHPDYAYAVFHGIQVSLGATTILNAVLQPPGSCVYVAGDCDHNFVPLELGDVIAMIGMYRGAIPPYFICSCPPHGNDFAPTADPSGNCVAMELNDVVVEIAAYRGSMAVSGCGDCPALIPE